MVESNVQSKNVWGMTDKCQRSGAPFRTGCVLAIALVLAACGSNDTQVHAINVNLGDDWEDVQERVEEECPQCEVEKIQRLYDMERFIVRSETSKTIDVEGQITRAYSIVGVGPDGNVGSINTTYESMDLESVDTLMSRVSDRLGDSRHYKRKDQYKWSGDFVARNVVNDCVITPDTDAKTQALACVAKKPDGNQWVLTLSDVDYSNSSAEFAQLMRPYFKSLVTNFLEG